MAIQNNDSSPVAVAGGKTFTTSTYYISPNTNLDTPSGQFNVGDVVIYTYAILSTTATVTPSASPTISFTRQATLRGTAISFDIWRGVFTTGLAQGANIAVTHTASTSTTCFVAETIWRGLDTTTPIDTVSALQAGTSTAPSTGTVSSIQPASGAAMHAHGAWNGTATATFANNTSSTGGWYNSGVTPLTTGGSATSNLGSGAAVRYPDPSTTNYNGPQNWTLSASETWNAIIISLRAAGAVTYIPSRRIGKRQ